MTDLPIVLSGQAGAADLHTEVALAGMQLSLSKGVTYADA